MDDQIRMEVEYAIAEMNKFLNGDVTIEHATDIARDLQHKLNIEW